MSKVRYLLFALTNLDIKKMFKTLKKISVKANKNVVVIFFDLVWCGFRYQAGYHDYLQAEFYSLNSKERKTYITRGINNQLIKKFNDKSEWHKFQNKALFQTIFKEYTKREYLILENNANEFECFLKKHGVVIIKPISGDGGRGIQKIEYNNKLNIEELYDELVNNKQLLIEECIIQHDKINELYSGSVNTIRLFTFVKNGESYFLRAIFKIGNGEVVDNYANKGMFTVLSDEGKVLYQAIDKDGNVYEYHPITNQKIVDFQVPFFKETVALVLEAAKVVPKVAYIGWDVAITNDGPIIVEGNCYPGIFQMKPSVKKNKIGDLPKFNEIMEIF